MEKEVVKYIQSFFEDRGISLTEEQAKTIFEVYLLSPSASLEDFMVLFRDVDKV